LLCIVYLIWAYHIYVHVTYLSMVCYHFMNSPTCEYQLMICHLDVSILSYMSMIIGYLKIWRQVFIHLTSSNNNKCWCAMVHLNFPFACVLSQSILSKSPGIKIANNYFSLDSYNLCISTSILELEMPILDLSQLLSEWIKLWVDPTPKNVVESDMPTRRSHKHKVPRHIP